MDPIQAVGGSRCRKQVQTNPLRGLQHGGITLLLVLQFRLQHNCTQTTKFISGNIQIYMHIFEFVNCAISLPFSLHRHTHTHSLAKLLTTCNANLHTQKHLMRITSKPYLSPAWLRQRRSNQWCSARALARGEWAGASIYSMQMFIQTRQSPLLIIKNDPINRMHVQ